MAGIFTVSLRITEYGSDKEIKKGWNAFTLAGAATPIPTDGDNANPFAYHVVIVSGTFTFIVLSPVVSLRWK